MAYEVLLGEIGTLKASADLSAKQFYFVKMSGAGTVTNAAGATDHIIGVLQNDPSNAAGKTDTAEVCILGISKVKTGGSITAGDQLTSDANGAAITASAGNYIGGIAITSATSGDIIPVLVTCGVVGNVASAVVGVASGYKVARGVHQIAAASDTVVTGLTTVVAAVTSFQDAPTANIVIVAADIGDQAGSPAAGSILIKSYKTASSPVAATVFTDNIHVGWLAVGT